MLNSFFFSNLPLDKTFRVSASLLFESIIKLNDLTRERIQLHCYDSLGNGTLTESQLEQYVTDTLPQCPQLQRLSPDFEAYYVFAAVRKIMFLFDKSKRGRISISRLVTSDCFAEFLQMRFTDAQLKQWQTQELRRRLCVAEASLGSAKGPAAQPIMRPKLPTNWFALVNTQEIYALYLGLDTNQNGMLSSDEFSKWGASALTSLFVEHLFATQRMYVSESGELEMDYKAFLDFVLSQELRGTEAAIRYLFAVMDEDCLGYLTREQIAMWYSAIKDKMVSLGHTNCPSVEIIVNECFDMINPKSDNIIELDELITNPCGYTVLSILISVTEFWKYDNRESLMQQELEENDEV